MSDLKTRFLTFCRQFEGVEDIDSLLKREHHALQLHVADFFFENRTIICEIKTLESETANKMLTFMAENGIDPELLQPGEHDVQNLFAQLTNGEALFRKATDLVMK